MKLSSRKQDLFLKLLVGVKGVPWKFPESTKEGGSKDFQEPLRVFRQIFPEMSISSLESP